MNTEPHISLLSKIIDIQAVYITVSIGVAFYRGDAMEPLQLIKQADDAMSLAKKAGGNTFKIQTLYFE